MSSAEVSERNEVAAASDDEQLVEALDRYIDSLKSGIPIKKADLLRDYPHVSEELETCLASLDFISHANPAASAAAPAAGETRLKQSTDCDDDLPVDPGAGSQQILGDYRIIREVGRGGMGVVYEAQQISLDRQVALKVLPFAAALDRRQLARFKQEAHAAAQLHHSNIVPVFAVGAERGVHYYAMQFVDGQSVADLIQELRQGEHVEANSTLAAEKDPTARTSRTSTQTGDKQRVYFRMAAELGVNVAKALEYAHEMGIVHRDVKPSNLMIDERQHVWVADFGLARLEAEHGLTMTGDLVGTLRYMSPEQLLGNRVPVDHRTDVYSLGVTLYELLTHRPPFEGDDRNELIRQISFDEPPLPRQLNKNIPFELETILLKAMSKNPEVRYATAIELADDLQRFLDDKPIKARRPSLQDRLGKWVKRHRRIVQATFALLVVACIGLLAGTIMLAQERAKTEKALQLSEDHFENAHNAITRMFNVIDEAQYYQEPAIQPVIRDTAEVAADYLATFADERNDDPLLLWKLAVAQLRLGKIWGILGDDAQSESAYNAALTTAENLVQIRTKAAQKDQDNVEAQRDLAVAYRIYAFSTKAATGDLEQANQHAAKMCNIFDRLVDAHPGRMDLRTSYGHALFFRADLIDDAEENHETCLDLVTRASRHIRVVFDSNDDPNEVGDLLASAHVESGMRLTGFGRHDEALAEYRESLAIREQLDGEQKSYIARLRYNIALQLERLDRLDEAAESADQSRKLYQQLIDERSGLQRDRDRYCMSAITFARTLRKLNRYSEISDLLIETRRHAAGLTKRQYQIGGSFALAAQAVHNDEDLTEEQAQFRDQLLVESLRSLNIAVDEGWTDFGYTKKDPGFELLRSQPGFSDVLDRASKVAADQTDI